MKWIYQTTVKDLKRWIVGSSEEEEYIQTEADDEWELMGPPVYDQRGEWIYYWRKKEE